MMSAGSIPPPTANIVFEENWAPGRWEPLEPEAKPLAAFAQIYLASVHAAPDEGLEPSAPCDPHDGDSPGTFVTADMGWQAQNNEAEELIQGYAQRIQEMEALHLREMEELRASLAQDLSKGFADAVSDVESRIAAELNTRLSSLLSPLLTEQARRVSVAAIVEELLSLILSGKLSPIKLSGPAPMISEVRLAMGSVGDRIVFADVPSTDLVIEVESRIISTRLSEWSDCLQAALS